MYNMLQEIKALGFVCMHTYEFLPACLQYVCVCVRVCAVASLPVCVQGCMRVCSCIDPLLAATV